MFFVPLRRPITGPHQISQLDSHSCEGVFIRTVLYLLGAYETNDNSWTTPVYFLVTDVAPGVHQQPGVTPWHDGPLVHSV